MKIFDYFKSFSTKLFYIVGSLSLLSIITIAVEKDFQGVKFATRSFIDEFYNLFMKTPDTNTFRVELTNVPTDIKAMLDAVSRTQVRAKVIPSHSQEVAFKNVTDFLNYFSKVVL